MKNLLNKIDFAKVAGIAGTILSVGATILTGWSSDKKLNQTVENKVKEALAKKN